MIENKLYIGIDNGVSGTIGVIINNKSFFFEIPIMSEQNYTKAKGNISRINGKKLKFELLKIFEETNPISMMCLMERPMVNPGRFQASTSALRALEATLITIEDLGIPYQYEDSKKWQKLLLPSGVIGTDQLKESSKTIGIRLFPQHSVLINKHKDADGLLLAEYCRRNF
jgi:hypothetical protein